MTIVRLATHADSQQIVDVIAQAFEKSELGHQGEAELPAAAAANQAFYADIFGGQHVTT